MKKLPILAIVGLALASTATMANDYVEHLEDSKPSAYNAPVMKKLVSNQFMCSNGENITANFVDFNTVQITSMNGENTLMRDYHDTAKTVYPFHRPLEGKRMEVYKNDFSTFKHNATKAVYSYNDVEGNHVTLECEASQ